MFDNCSDIYEHTYCVTLTDSCIQPSGHPGSLVQYQPTEATSLPKKTSQQNNVNLKREGSPL